MENRNEKGEMSFLQHLEALRWHLVRAVTVVVIAAVVLFCYKSFLFDEVLFGAMKADFWTYRMMCKLSVFLNLGDALCISDIPFELFNPTLSGQFTLHMWVAFVGGIIIGFPYVLWELWRFIKPALRVKEKKYATGFVFFASVLFVMGVLFGYYVIAPLSINFLGSYRVSETVKNIINMDSYISTITTITLATGALFELPIIVYFLTMLGIVSPDLMRRFRRHSIVVILIIAAIITPSPDITSQLLVAFPLYILYEASIFVSVYVKRKKAKLQ